jgi:hypothetical protein
MKTLGPHRHWFIYNQLINLTGPVQLKNLSKFCFHGLLNNSLNN